MKDKYFIDTNIIVYSFDNDSPVKRDTARDIIALALSSGNGIISFQVIQEFINVAARKFKKPLLIPDLFEFLEQVLLPLCAIFPGNDFYRNSVEIMERTRYSFYDSMIIQAALEGGCTILYSEDLQHGFKLFDVTVKNPFK